MIVGLSGYAGSGKDEVAKIMKEFDESWQIKKFSKKLKQVASILSGVDEDAFEDSNFKSGSMDNDWFVWEKDSSYHGVPKMRSMTVREFLQKLGTDAIRNGLHENAWVNALVAEYFGTYNIDTDTTTYPKWVVTDCRFHNEAFAIKDRGGIVVRINRPGVGPVNEHKSETVLDGFRFDLTIDNDGTIEDLKSKVKLLLYDIQ